MHIARGNNRCPIFIADDDYGCFRHQLQEACDDMAAISMPMSL